MYISLLVLYTKCTRARQNDINVHAYSQAFGAREFALVGVLLQRCLLIVTLLCLPIFFLRFFATSPVLVMLGGAANSGGARGAARPAWPRDFIGFPPTSHRICIGPNGSYLPLAPLSDRELSPYE